MNHFVLNYIDYIIDWFSNRMQNMRCAICRETTALSDVAYVDTRPESNELDGVPVQVKGSHSTKVGAVVQQLLKIKAKEPEAKCLVFSTVSTQHAHSKGFF